MIRCPALRKRGKLVLHMVCYLALRSMSKVHRGHWGLVVEKVLLQLEVMAEDAQIRVRVPSQTRNLLYVNTIVNPQGSPSHESRCLSTHTSFRRHPRLALLPIFDDRQG